MNEKWWLGWRAVQAGNVPPWAWVLAAVLLVLLAWALLRGRRHDPAGDRDRPGAPITAPQVDFLHYLQQVFPDEAVLFRPPFDRVLAVRKSERTARARARLAGAPLDYVVCGDQGRPRFAFLVDRFQDLGADRLTARAAELNHMLKTAGVRLIRIKGSPHELAPPEQMRARLVHVARAPAADESSFSPSAFQGSAFRPSSFDTARGPSSTVMGMSTLMGAGDSVEDDPWSSVRKR